ncbi:heparan-alpha-glucosaminide N-acetyltransferase domain-containing protein [Flavihumibacter fluvii]|uniref:heparan-alpha-glucosaminide N-acetyltransferase domain-containing protein n=1 Tax=Flavihumibacter fluvii TaxID=2838157 RepID=UPI001BDF0B26|nr:heparan-alpha-glucosaminide N-acetyltransferase domain-containing protein [Flavihumibacter fluvii]ULQ50885.1 heparan-alpha-glucosaminide N-acetyltransferase domain-containing protein [Flavihumibacter fluvii]
MASINLLRGVIIIIMALDHCRSYFHAPAQVLDSMDLETTSPILFGTRWITHLCVSIFVFLSGISAWLQHEWKTTRELSSFLITRGLC